MPISWPVPEGAVPTAAARAKSSPGSRKSGGGGGSSKDRKARACTSDILSPSQRTWGTIPPDYCELIFETLDPIAYNRSKTRNLQRDDLNAIIYKAIKATSNNNN
jgi:hypothetical protein